MSGQDARSAATVWFCRCQNDELAGDLVFRREQSGDVTVCADCGAKSPVAGCRELPPEHPIRRQVEEGSAAARAAMPSVKLPLPDRQARSAANVERTPAMVMRGTPADGPKVRRLLDEVAARLPNDEIGHALYAWAEEVTRLVEGLD